MYVVQSKTHIWGSNKSNSKNAHKADKTQLLINLRVYFPFFFFSWIVSIGALLTKGMKVLYFGGMYICRGSGTFTPSWNYQHVLFSCHFLYMYRGPFVCLKPLMGKLYDASARRDGKISRNNESQYNTNWPPRKCKFFNKNTLVSNHWNRKDNDKTTWQPLSCGLAIVMTTDNIPQFGEFPAGSRWHVLLRT